MKLFLDEIFFAIWMKVYLTFTTFVVLCGRAARADMFVLAF